jgi:ferredoxin
MTVRFVKPTHEHDTGLCERNLNLLAHAQAIELDIGSRCGGHGICGGDRIKPDNAALLSPITDAERGHLTPEELAQGWRLACQCFPQEGDKNIQIILPDPL